MSEWEFTKTIIGRWKPTYYFSSFFFTDLNYDSTCMWFIPDLD